MTDMPRQPRIESPDDFFHIMSRGTGKQTIFLDDLDRKRFLVLLDNVVREYEWSCLSYALLGNHYHLIIQTPNSNMAAGMQYLNGVFSMDFNRRHLRVGHVTQGRYTSKLLSSEPYFLTVLRYVALNPAKDGFCSNPSDWVWSSYPSLIGATKPLSLLDRPSVWNLFSDDSESAQERLREFVELTDDHGLPIPYDELGPLEASLESDIQCLIDRRPPLDIVFFGLDSRDDRNRRIRKAYSTYRYTLREIGEHLGLDTSSIHRIVASSAEECCGTRRFRKPPH